MSSILDALERADEERGLDSKKRHKSVSSSTKQLRLNPRLMAVAIALIVLVNAIVWFLLLPDEVDPETRQKPAAVEVETPVVKAESPVGESQPKINKPVPKPVVSVPEQLKRTTLPSAKPLIEEAVVKKSQTRQEPARPVEQPPEPKVDVEEQVSAPAVEAAKPIGREVPQARKLPESRKETVVQPRLVKPEVVMAPPVEVLQEGPDVAGPAGSEAEQIPLIWELPQNLRERVLQLQSSIHVYSENPEERFVIINMKRYQEGDRLTADGFTLERIDRNGIVVDYGRGLVRLERR